MTNIAVPQRNTRFLQSAIIAVAWLLALPAESRAQISSGSSGSPGSSGGGQNTGIAKSFMTSFGNMDKQKILITPSFIVADVERKTATIVFSNQTSDTLTAEITAGVKQPSQGGGLSGATPPRKDPKAQASALLAESSDSTSAETADSIAASQSMVDWIKELPASIRLAPGQHETVTVKLDVPSNVKPGEYSAWIIVVTDATLKLGSLLPNDADHRMEQIRKGVEQMGIGLKNSAGAKMVYRAEAATP